MVEAGLGIRESADALIDSKPPAAIRQMAQDLISGLEDKKSISQSIQQTPLENTILHAGESGGRLADAFHYLGDYFSLLVQGRKAVISACIYPAILLHLGLIISAITGPELFSEGLDAGKVTTRLVISLMIAYGLIGGLFFFIKKLLKSGSQSATIDRLLNLIPLVGSCRHSFAMARYTKVYHTALLAGLPMEKTVSLSAESAHSGQVSSVEKILLETVSAGQQLGPTYIEVIPVFPSTFSRAYSTAEKAGQLDKELARWAGIFQNDAETASKRLSTTIPKMIYGIIVLFVAWRILSFALNYYHCKSPLHGHSAI